MATILKAPHLNGSFADLLARRLLFVARVEEAARRGDDEGAHFADSRALEISAEIGERLVALTAVRLVDLLEAL